MILVMGLKKTGQSITNYLTGKGRPYAVFDKNEDILLRYDILGVKTYRENDEINDRTIDLVIKSPGISPNEKHVAYFLKKGVKVISDIEFFYNEFNPKNTIAITGTNGKTTTTEMVGELLKSKEPIVAGNIGMTIFDESRDKDDIYIFELSSFQLESTYAFRPKIAVLLNIEEDHLDWHGSFENYKMAKYKIFKNQTPNDALIIDADHIDEADIKTASKIYKYSVLRKDGMNAYVDGDSIFIDINGFKYQTKLENLRYKESHNIGNMFAAILASSFFGITKSMVDDFISRFRLDLHRVEYVGTKRGVRYINDSKATNPSATVSSLLNTEKNTILLLGGYDKETDFKDVITYSKNNIKKMIFFGNIKEKLKNTADKVGATNYLVVDKFKDAFDAAVKNSEKGDTVLLSPGASSFDEFSGYEERGDYFKKLVGEITNEETKKTKN